MASLNGWELAPDAAPGTIAAFGKYGADFTVQLQIVINGVTPHNSKDQMSGLKLAESLGSQSYRLETRVDQNRAILRTDMGGGFELESALRFERSWVELDAIVRYLGDEPQRLRRLDWITEGADEREYGSVELFGAGTMPVMDEPIDLHRRLSEYKSANIVSQVATESAPHNSSGMMGTYNVESGTAQASWFLSESFPLDTHGLYRDARLTRRSCVYCPRWMRRGDELRVGTFFFGIERADRMECVRLFAESLTRMNWDSDADYAALRDINLLELYIGDKGGRRLFSTYDQAAAQLPKIKALGFNAIEIMPSFPWPSYSVVDFFDIQATYGDPDGLRRFIDRAHALGIRVLLDMVFHGPRDFSQHGIEQKRSPLLDEHPDWFIRTEHGVYAKTYTRAFDLANPDYQQYILDAMLFYLRDWHADGFRLDAQQWNALPNWDPAIDRQPYETLLAGYRMMDDIRARVLSEFPSAFFYTEARAPGAGRRHEYRYNYDYHWLYPSLCKVVDPRGMCVMTHNYGSENTMTWPDAAMWCEENAALQPKGLVIVHQVDSHDSAEWSGYVGGQYCREAFGDAAYEVLFALAAFLDGGMMALWGSFDGHEEYVGRILSLRRDHPSLRHGCCRHTALRCDDPKTVTLMWTQDHGAAAYVGNLEDVAKTVSLRVRPGTLPTGARFCAIDLITLAPLGEMTTEDVEAGLALPLKPFGKLVISLKRMA